MKSVMRGLLLACGLLSTVASQPAVAGEIGFPETFALAKDREAALAQLIPGTEDYYYYHCLHHQHLKEWAKVDALLKTWIERYKHTPRVLEIENRQALLTYDTNPQRALSLITNRLNLNYSHQREELNRRPDVPNKLDPKLIAREQLTRIAFSQFGNTLQGFEEAALDWLITAELNPEQRRQLLSRLQRPDYKNLVELIAADLNHIHSGGFGQFEIHRRLLLSQLDELLKLKPELRNQSNFVNVYLTRLHPTNDINWRQDPKALEAYLDRLWSFVATLDPVHNSLKVHVLYHRLVLDRSRGVYDPARFMTYLKLPRQTGYIQHKWANLDVNRQFMANLQQDFAAVTLLPAVGDDEPLVRSYLQHFFVDAKDFKEYVPYIEDLYLKHLFAETKIVHGLGDAETWYSMLPPSMYQQLKERIDLDFAFTNKIEFGVNEKVALDLDVKNVDTLIVKVFEINTQNFYRAQLREVGPDVNLDGLVANEEKTYNYKEPPLRRVRRHFEFPTLNKRGVYVIDFIGNGRSSRALIRKGKFRLLNRTSTAGQIFTVLNEQNQRVDNAVAWLAGIEYQADKDGTIALPFSNQPSRQPLVISADGFSSLEHFQQQSEQYQLSAAMFVDREQLISRRKAMLMIRPRLSLNGTPVSRKVLEDVRLAITSTDLDGVASTREIVDLKLFDDRETVQEFQVPHRLANIRFLLRAKVQNQSQNQKVDLAVEQSFSINEIDRTDKTEDLHFSRVGDDYVVDLLGKTGEPKRDRGLQISLKMRNYTQPVHVTLSTDAQGRTTLGTLPEVVSVTATAANGVAHTWVLRHDEHTYAQAMHGVAGQPIYVPYMGTAEKPSRDEISLLELRGDNFAIDRFDAVTIEGGLLKISKLPAGDYSLLLKTGNKQIRLRLTEGPREAGFVLGNFRKLNVPVNAPLQLKPIEVTEKTIRIQVQNNSKVARVHVFATRFQPAFSAYNNLSSIVGPEPLLVTTPRVESQYVAGRNIGDEYRYIIDRKFARRFPGNMLERPSLLLNPWAIRSTETGQQIAAEGEAFKGEPKPALTQATGGGLAAAVSVPQADFANLDFLAVSSTLLLNESTDEKGILEIKREDLGGHQELLIVAVDPENTASRIVTLPAGKSEHLDLRLAKGLDPAKHFTQQKRISLLKTKETLTIADITSTRFESYDSLGRVYSLYATLNGDPKMVEFSFVSTWPSLKNAEKQALYRKYAGHELHLFLYKKDPEFFKTAIRPYLANKKEKQFIDRWLLDDDLQEYLLPWNFEQLNTLERILLSQRLADEKTNISRLINDQFALLPPNADRFNQLFQTAIKGSDLDIGDRLGLRGAQLRYTIAKPIYETKTGEALGEIQLDQLKLADGIASNSAPASEKAAMDAPAPPGMALSRAAGRADGAKKESDGRRRDTLDRSRDAKGLKDKDSDGETEYFADDFLKRKQIQQYYRKLDKTMEWVESSYFKLPLDQQTPALISTNPFWRDVANHDPKREFVSTNLAEASRNFPEMLTALALLDLPFKADEHQTEYKEQQLTLTAGSPMIVFHEEIQPAIAASKPAKGADGAELKTGAESAAESSILVSQNFFRHGDRHRQINNEQVDNFVTEEFLVDTVYGCHIVVTNPTSSLKKVDVLLQIPVGAMPVSNGQVTRSVHVALQPYHTQTLEYYFYFPSAGKFAHYPVQVANEGKILGFAAPFTFNVVKALTKIDKQSWDYISQYGSVDDVVNFIKTQNVLQVNLDRIAWRMQDKAVFNQLIKLLAGRHIYNNTLWSYSVKHNAPAEIKQFLQFATNFVQQSGAWLDSPLLVIDPIERKTYEQMDYRPLVNARVGQLGRQREILNDRFLAQYQRLMHILSYRSELDSIELMTVTYYLLLQDRVEEAVAHFDRVKLDQLSTKLQHDYFAAYLNFYRAEPAAAKKIAAKYAEYPVESWRLAFLEIVKQADEIVNKAEVAVVDDKDRTQLQTSAAAATPSFDFTVEARTVKLNFQNLSEVRVNYYRMDIELLFSRNPFVQNESKQFSYILPNASQTIKLPAKGTSHEFPLPKELANTNVLVEISGGGQTIAQPYYSNDLRVQTIEAFGQVHVTGGTKSTPLSKVYVKAYARMKDGTVRFYKDGYTDLRGRFDYTSLSTNELDFVERFSLLILSDDYGAAVREAKPPKR